MNPEIENKMRVAIYELEGAIAMLRDMPDPLDESNVLDISLADAGVMQRSAEAMEKAHCATVRDLLNVTVTDLRAHNVSDCTIIDSLQIIAKHFAIMWMGARAISEAVEIRAGDL
ncbi:MAG: hypothetical protein IIB55_03825 [Planctomycetes bacterium]|nr:hypothetical protein [Planctomycetota bacterium]